MHKYTTYHTATPTYHSCTLSTTKSQISNKSEGHMTLTVATAEFLWMIYQSIVVTTFAFLKMFFDN